LKTIYKYPIRFDNAYSIDLPKGATILTAQMQGEGLFVWAMIDPDETATERRWFRVHGTGHRPIEDTDSLRWIGTVQLHGGALVFHVFVRE
jgi:hypothetical protein